MYANLLLSIALPRINRETQKTKTHTHNQPTFIRDTSSDARDRASLPGCCSRATQTRRVSSASPAAATAPSPSPSPSLSPSPPPSGSTSSGGASALDMASVETLPLPPCPVLGTASVETPPPPSPPLLLSQLPVAADFDCLAFFFSSVDLRLRMACWRRKVLTRLVSFVKALVA